MNNDERNWFRKLCDKFARDDDSSLTTATLNLEDGTYEFSAVSSGEGWTCTMTECTPETEEEKAERLARREKEKKENRNEAWQFAGAYYIFISVIFATIGVVNSLVTHIMAQPIDVMGLIFNGFGFVAMVFGIIGIAKIIITLLRNSK